MSGIQVTDALIHAACEGTGISFYVASCLLVRTCSICALSSHREEEATGAPSHLDNFFLLESSSSFPRLSKGPPAPIHPQLPVIFGDHRSSSVGKETELGGEGQALGQKTWMAYLHFKRDTRP